MHRLIPAVGLFFLAPLVAEYLLGDLPVTALAGLMFLAPWYGGGALLIREMCRRNGWGWPPMLVLALAFGIIEEGLTTQSLFNPGYADKHLLTYGHVSVLGMGASWTVFVLTLHVIWSIGTPIAMMELLSPSRSTTPWLGRIALAVTAALFLLGGTATALQTYEQSHFVASPAQLAGAGIAAVLAVLIAVVLGSRRGPPVQKDGRPPAAGLLVLVSLLVTSAVTTAWYLGKDVIASWLYVVSVLACGAAGILLARQWSRLRGWGATHQLALAAGALLTYAWQGFGTAHMLIPASAGVELASHVLFAVGALLLIAAATLRVRGSAAPHRREFRPPHERDGDVVAGPGLRPYRPGSRR